MNAPHPDGSERWEERLVHSAQGYIARTWQMNPRETLHQAERYSRFVRVMKRALPATAFLLALAVLVYALQPRDTTRMALAFERMAKIDNDLTMLHPRLTGTDDDGMPFVVTADSAVPEDQSNDRVRMENIAADLTMKDGTMLHITAAMGVVDSKTHVLDASGGVRFVSPQGYTAQTPSATANLKTGIMHGEAGITTEGKLGHLSAAGFQLDKEAKQLRFLGNVHTLINRDAAK